MKRVIALAAFLVFVFTLNFHAVAQNAYIGVKFGLAQQKTKFEELEAFYATEYSTVYGFCIGANVLYYIRIPVVQPYLSAGMGSYNVTGNTTWLNST